MIGRRRIAAAFMTIGCTASLLAGCATNRTELDSVTFGAGNAMHHNRVVHTVDPWPKYAWQVDLQTQADRSPLLRDREAPANGSTTPPDGSAPQEPATEPN